MYCRSLLDSHKHNPRGRHTVHPATGFYSHDDRRLPHFEAYLPPATLPRTEPFLPAPIETTARSAPPLRLSRTLHPHYRPGVAPGKGQDPYPSLTAPLSLLPQPLLVACPPWTVFHYFRHHYWFSADPELTSRLYMTSPFWSIFCCVALRHKLAKIPRPGSYPARFSTI